jgi:hypothetical protein
MVEIGLGQLKVCEPEFGAELFPSTYLLKANRIKGLRQTASFGPAPSSNPLFQRLIDERRARKV